MKFHPRQLARVALIIVLLMGGACRKSTSVEPDPAPKSDLPRIGVSLLTRDNLYFVELSMAMQSRGGELGYDVVVESAQLDASRQDAHVRQFIADDVAAIVLCPVDSTAIGPAIAAANTVGIPVFTADTGVLAEGVAIAAHIATDNYRGGELAADAMVEALGGTGRVAIVDHPGVESVELRTRGFEARLAELAAGEAGVEIVARAPGHGDTVRAKAATSTLLAAHGDLDGIFAINDPSALGVVAALEGAGRLDNIVVVGFDGQPEALALLVAGKIYADILQLPKQIGHKTIDTVAAHARGKAFVDQQLIPPTLIRRPDVQRQEGP